jgi:hypothetical protein
MIREFSGIFSDLTAYLRKVPEMVFASGSAGEMRLSRAQDRLFRMGMLIVILIIAGVVISWVNRALTAGLGIGARIAVNIVCIAIFLYIIKVLMIRKYPKKIPVFMYHSVADDFDRMIWQGIVMPVDLFRRQLSYLKRKGYATLFLSEVIDLMNNPSAIPEKPIALTFDDGFLDNWTTVFPLLRQFGMKGTFFITTSFIEPAEQMRPVNRYDDDGFSHGTRPQIDGYMSLNELSVMANSGHAEIGSHAVTHSWCFTGPELVDFYRPGSPFPWVLWNEMPDRCYDWMRDPALGESIYGIPIYRNGRNLVSRKYHDDQELKARLLDHVRENGGGSFFDDPGRIDGLFRIVRDWRAGRGDRGYLESVDDFRERIRFELTESKSKLEKELNVQVGIFCWPGDLYTDEGRRIALDEAGYRATTSTGGFNTVGGDSTCISRSYAGAFFSRAGLTGLDMYMFIIKIRLQEGNFLWYIPLIPLLMLKKLCMLFFKDIAGHA